MRFMTQDEVFGERIIRSNEEEREQFEPMLNRRNRIADIGFASGEWGWYWLKDRDVANATLFALVTGDGYAAAANASNSSGVRPAFKISLS